MDQQDIINQLESLKDNSLSSIDPLEPGSEWHKDIWALDYAIAVIELEGSIDNKAIKSQVNAVKNYINLYRHKLDIEFMTAQLNAIEKSL